MDGRNAAARLFLFCHDTRQRLCLSPMNEAAYRCVCPEIIYRTRPIWLETSVLWAHTFQQAARERGMEGRKITPRIFSADLEKKHPRFVPLMRGQDCTTAAGFYRLMTLQKHNDCATGKRVSACRLLILPVTTPELDMWLPRITGGSKYDLESYEDW